MGALKTYDVSGMNVLGTDKPAPAGTVLRLSDTDAERLGLKGKAEKSEAATPAKPRRAAGTRKRPALKGKAEKSEAATPAKPRRAAGTRKRPAPAPASTPVSTPAQAPRTSKK
jgi:hypothetical protein